MNALPVRLALQFAVTVTLWYVGGPAPAAETEPADIAAQRAQVQSRFVDATRSCQEQFIVTSCVEAARQEQIRDLARLKKLQDSIDEAQRKEKAALRLKAIDDRQREQALREQAQRQAAAATASEAASRAPANPNPVVPHKSGPARAGSSASARADVEARNTAAFEARRQSIEAHREAVERRNGERASKGKVAAPLPLPGSAPTP